MKKLSILYLVVCLFVCALPFVGMVFARTDTTTEKRELASLPTEFSEEYLSELGTYFTDHFAFRNELVNVDTLLNSKLFGVSTAERVVVGKNNWLYYQSTLDNYLGRNLMTEKQIENAANNLRLMQEYVTSQGKQFLLIIPPNKNSLYDENMPFTESYKVSNEKNIDHLVAKLKEYGVNYLDLFELFNSQEEVLYYQRDSHWNTKGALLAYQTILDYLQIEHNTYEDATMTTVNDYVGDLNLMLYPLSAVPEEDTDIDIGATYTCNDNFQSVEDASIQTTNEAQSGSLLMFRDSFGNALLPFMANAFGDACFQKGVPYRLGMYLSINDPDVVIIEKVERNLLEFATKPAIFEPLPCTKELPENIESSNASFELEMTAPQSDPMYWRIQGELSEEADRVYVRIHDGESTVYEALTVSTDDSDNGYLLYINQESIRSEQIELELIVENSEGYQSLGTKEITISEIPSVEE